MGLLDLYEQHLLPRLVDRALAGEVFGQVRSRYLEGLHGAVLEVGFGSGLNLPHYPETVEVVYGVEPARLARRLASGRIERAPFPVELVGLSGERIPLADASVDGAASTWTLCTIPDLALALTEVRRVLKPGRPFHFVEHGRSPEPRVARWQDRLTPLQRKLAGGCHLNRSIDREIEAAGFAIERLERFYLEGPKLVTYIYAGRAVARRRP